jgi:DNA polymerase-3 subunit beta
VRANAIDVVVPASLLRQVGDALPGGGQTGLRLAGDRVTFDVGGETVSAEPMKGKYPDYRLLMPRTVVAEAQFERAVLLSICTLLDPAHSTLTLSLGQSDVVTLVNSQTGERTQGTLPGVAAAQTSKGPLQVTFTAQYVAEALETMTTSRVLLRTGGARSPTVLTEGGAATGFLHLLMPVAGA